MGKTALEYLRAQFPLLTFTAKTIKQGVGAGKLLIRGAEPRGQAISIWVDGPNDYDLKGRESAFFSSHLALALKAQLDEMYPDLYWSVQVNANHIFAGCWVLRIYDAPGSPLHGQRMDGTAMDFGFKNVLDRDFHRRAAEYQERARLARQEGWFYCSGHDRPEPKEDYGYFYFAGSYCKEYGVENPEHQKRAREETYN